MIAGMLRPFTFFVQAFAAAAIAAGVGACSTHEPRSLLQSPPTSAALNAADVYRPGSPVREFAGAADVQGKRERREHGAADSQGVWKLTISRQGKSGSWNIVRVVTFARSADGSVSMVTADDAKDHSITRFNPPLVVMPATLRAGTPFVAESQVEIVKAADGSLMERGSAKAGAELKGTDGHATDLLSTLTMQLSAAKVNQITLQTVRPDQGVVAEDETLSVTVGPLQIRSSHEVWSIAAQ